MVPFRVVLGKRDPFAFYGMADYRRRPIVVERHLAKQLPQRLDIMTVDLSRREAKAAPFVDPVSYTHLTLPTILLV